MQLNPLFAALLAGVLLTFSQHVVAAPAKRQPNMITLPLKRVEQRSDVHPQILLQQHINRGIRRLARMTGRDVSDHELRANLERRIASIEDEDLMKRYNRQGVPKASRSVNEFRKKKQSAAGAVGAGAAAGAAASGAGASAAAGGAVPIIAGAPQVAPNTVTVSNDPGVGQSLALDIEANDVGYLATVQIGSPPQDYLILMDSGSADFWVGSENCQSEDGGDCGNHVFLGAQSSSTFQDTQQPFEVTYGTGNVQGTIVTDDLSIAGLVLKAHTFGTADQESVDFSSNDTPFDGLMGLAQSTLSEQQTLTPVESLAQQGLISAAITSYKIPRLADNLKDGEISFGGLDPAKFDSKTLVTFPNVNQQGFWEGAMDDVSVDGTSTKLQGRTAILDSGTTLIVAPPADAAAVHQLIQGAASDGQGGFTVPCDTTASVALTFAGQTFKIDPRDIAFQQVEGNTCSSGISAGNIGGDTEWLVGDVFLKNAYFSTNVDDNTLSLAELA